MEVEGKTSEHFKSRQSGSVGKRVMSNTSLNSSQNFQDFQDELMTQEVLDAAASYQEDQQSLVERKYRNKVLCKQILMFTISYFGYSFTHVYREFWAQSKPVIEQNYDKYHSDKEMLSNVDFANFLCYGLSLFVNGTLADQFNLQKLLPINYILQAIIYLGIAMTGFFGGTYAYVQFYVWFMLLGLI